MPQIKRKYPPRRIPIASLYRHKGLKRKTRIKRVGKIGRANIEANKRLRVLFSEVSRCEMGLEGCLKTWTLAFAHRKKRLFYKGDVTKLSNPNHVVIACVHCHQITEFNRSLNDEVFLRLRGKDELQ